MLPPPTQQQQQQQHLNQLCVCLFNFAYAAAASERHMAANYFRCSKRFLEKSIFGRFNLGKRSERADSSVVRNI